jgi:hypothetical protein
MLLYVMVKKKRECLSALPPWSCRFNTVMEIKVPKNKFYSMMFF